MYRWLGIRFEEFRAEKIEEWDEGWRGKVFRCRWEGVECAVKVALGPEHVPAIQKEIAVLLVVNRFRIGPRIFAGGIDFFVMEFVEGVHFEKLIENFESSREDFVKASAEILRQCRVLDKLYLSKPEMHRPLTNVLVRGDLSVVLLDFEGTVCTSKPKNVTSFCTFLLNHAIRRGLYPYWDERAKRVFSEYKKSYSESSFERILEFFGEIYGMRF